MCRSPRGCAAAWTAFWVCATALIAAAEPAPNAGPPAEGPGSKASRKAGETSPPGQGTAPTGAPTPSPVPQVGEAHATGAVSSAPPAAADPALDALLEKVDLRAAGVRDLRMRFEQDKFTPLLKKPMRSKGAIFVQGARTRWVTETPHPSIMLIEGSSLRIHYPEQKLLEIYEVDQRLGELAASPLPRLPVLRKYFDIRRLPNPDAAAGGGAEAGPLALRLIPKAGALREHVAEVRVTVDPATGLAMEVETKDPDGDRTVLRFSEPEVNRGLKDELFELAAPEGTTVTRPLEKLKPQRGGGEREAESR